MSTIEQRVEAFSETDLPRNICDTDQSFPLSEVKEAIQNEMLFGKQLL